MGLEADLLGVVVATWWGSSSYKLPLFESLMSLFNIRLSLHVTDRVDAMIVMRDNLRWSNMMDGLIRIWLVLGSVVVVYSMILGMKLIMMKHSQEFHLI